MVTQSLPSGPAAVVVAAGEHVGPDHVAVEGERAAGRAIAQDLVDPAAVGAGCAHVHKAVDAEGGIERDAHEAGLAVGSHAGHGVVRQLRRVGRAAREHEDVPRLLGDEHPSVGRERDIPR